MMNWGVYLAHGCGVVYRSEVIGSVSTIPYHQMQEKQYDNDDNVILIKNDDNDSVLIQRDSSTGEVIGLTSLLSANSDYKIPRLPRSMLPTIIKSSHVMTMNNNRKRPNEIIDDSTNGKKLVRFKNDDNTNDDSNNNNKNNNNTNDGLEKTIREMLKNYKPSSSEKRPFWCRVCQYQAVDMTDFDSHKSSQEHSLAAKIERKMTFCKLCKKQFTSMEQMKEHLKAKKHKDLLEIMKKKTSKGSRKFC